MVNTSTWPIKTLDVHSLTLDPENVRLRSVQPYESDILAYLFEYEDSLGLATEIAHDGFFDNDLPIVIRDERKIVVLEGNRRISALKGLSNPTSVPSHKKQLAQLRMSLSRTSLNDLQKVRVMEAPDRDSAQQILASLHTRNPKRSWPLDQQAMFYHAQLSSGATVKDLQERYPSVAGKIPRFIRMAEMYEVVRKSSLGEATLEEFAESKQFKMSIFERLYSSKDFQDKIGIDFKDDGHIKVTGKKVDVDRILSKVVLDMKTGYLNTRRLGKQDSKEFTGYIESLGMGRALPLPTKSATGLPSTSDTTQVATRPKRKSTTLNTAGIDFGLNSPALERRYLELKAINCVVYPNATLDLLRTVLECSLKQYLLEANDPIPSKPRGFVMFSDALDHALKHFRDKSRGNKAIGQIITKLKATPQNEVEFTKSATALNSVNHNPDVFFGPFEVREVWDSAYPLIKILLAGAASNSSPIP
jgi:hypothetical protein